MEVEEFVGCVVAALAVGINGLPTFAAETLSLVV